MEHSQCAAHPSMCHFPRAAVTKCHHLGGLKGISVLSQFWRLQSEIKVSAGLVSSGASLLGLADCHLVRVASHVVPSMPGLCLLVCVLISSSFKDISHSGFGPPLGPQSSLWGPHLQIQSHSEYCGLGLPHAFLGDTLQPITAGWSTLLPL